MTMQALEICIPHAVVFETDTQYRARVTRFKHRAGQMADTAVFQKYYKGKNADGSEYEETKNCVVGMEALNSAVRVVGADKYRLGYFDVYVCALLLKMFPNGHDNIALSMAHPPDAIPYLSTVIYSLYHSVPPTFQTAFLETLRGVIAIAEDTLAKQAVSAKLTPSDLDDRIVEAVNKAVADFAKRFDKPPTDTL